MGLRHDVDPFEIMGFHKHSRTEFEQRFWSKVARGDGTVCWLWRADKQSGGYGYFAVARNEMRLAHRVAWELTHGAIPDGIRVLHHCDNHLCVNPDHLFLGTARDNTQDMLTKGRHAHGESHPKTTLTTEQVLALRRMRAETGWPYRRIGAEFGISDEAAWKIATRRRWTHV